MKKFKNIKTGEVVKYNTENYYITTEEISVPKRFVEDSCDWKEVKDEVFEIVSFSYAQVWGEGNLAVLNNLGNYSLPSKIGWSLESLLNSGICVKSGEIKIHSVKRLSDGEVFTIGDKVKDVKYGIVDVIARLSIASCANSIYVSTKGLNWGQLIEDIEKVAFYTTYDGVDVEQNKEVFWTVNGVYKYPLPLCDLHLHLLKDSEVYKVFSTEEEAKKYQRSVVPTLFITEDGEDIIFGSTYWCVNTAPHLWSLFKQTAKERTILNKGVLAFSKKELAEEYILRNKPLLSLEEVLTVLGGKNWIFEELEKIAIRK